MGRSCWRHPASDGDRSIRQRPAAAGNAGPKSPPLYPAADPNSLGVGAVWTADAGGPFTWGSGAADRTTGADRLVSFSQRSATQTEVFAPGALITSLLFMIGKQFMELYFAHARLSSTYSAAGSPIVVLLWVYYSAQLFFWGAEFCKVYKRTMES